MQKRKKYSQAARMHDLLRLLESRHGLTIEEIAEETAVNRRTVHRDLNALHDAGYPLVSEWEEGRKLYRLMHKFREIPPVTFTLQELLTLSLLRSQSAPFQGTPFQERIDAIFRKINSVLPPRYVPH